MRFGHLVCKTESHRRRVQGHLSFACLLFVRCLSVAYPQAFPLPLLSLPSVPPFCQCWSFGSSRSVRLVRFVSCGSFLPIRLVMFVFFCSSVSLSFAGACSSLSLFRSFRLRWLLHLWCFIIPPTSSVTKSTTSYYFQRPLRTTAQAEALWLYSKHTFKSEEKTKPGFCAFSC